MGRPYQAAHHRVNDPLAVPRQLALPPMRLLFGRFELAHFMPVLGFHDADPR
jgi:hypothetical protein